MVLASRVLMIALVSSAIISGDLVLRTVALMPWSLTFVPLGLAVARSSDRAEDAAASTCR